MNVIDIFSVFANKYFIFLCKKWDNFFSHDKKIIIT